MDDTIYRIIIDLKDWRSSNISYEACASRDGGKTRRLRTGRHGGSPSAGIPAILASILHFGGTKRRKTWKT